MEIENIKDTVITLKEGKKEKEYKLKCKFYSDETEKEYWIYSDEVPNDRGEIELKVSSVSLNKDGETILKACTDENELNLVVNMYEALKKHVKINKE